MLDAYHHMEAMEYHAVMDQCLAGSCGAMREVRPAAVCGTAADSGIRTERIPSLSGVTELVRPAALPEEPASPASARVVDMPRENVMAEVVRRITEQF